MIMPYPIKIMSFAKQIPSGDYPGEAETISKELGVQLYFPGRRTTFSRQLKI